MNARFFVVIESTPIDSLGSLEELFLAREQLRILDNGYQDLKLETPEWITSKLEEVGHEITLRVRGELMRQLRALKARRAALRTKEERRVLVDQEIAELEAKLQ